MTAAADTDGRERHSLPLAAVCVLLALSPVGLVVGAWQSDIPTLWDFAAGQPLLQNLPPAERMNLGMWVSAQAPSRFFFPDMKAWIIAHSPLLVLSWLLVFVRGVQPNDRSARRFTVVAAVAFTVLFLTLGLPLLHITRFAPPRPVTPIVLGSRGDSSSWADKRCGVLGLNIEPWPEVCRPANREEPLKAGFTRDNDDDEPLWADVPCVLSNEKGKRLIVESIGADVVRVADEDGGFVVIDSSRGNLRLLDSRPPNSHLNAIAWNLTLVRFQRAGVLLLCLAPFVAWAFLAAAVRAGCWSYRPEGSSWHSAGLAVGLQWGGLTTGTLLLLAGLAIGGLHPCSPTTGGLLAIALIVSFVVDALGVLVMSYILLVLAMQTNVQRAWFGIAGEDV